MNLDHWQTKRKFYITASLNRRVSEDIDMLKAVTAAVKRFMRNDWGNVPEEDHAANNYELAHRCGRVLAKYFTPEGDIYINMDIGETEDTAVIMFTHEY